MFSLISVYSTGNSWFLQSLQKELLQRPAGISHSRVAKFFWWYFVSKFQDKETFVTKFDCNFTEFWDMIRISFTAFRYIFTANIDYNINLWKRLGIFYLNMIFLSRNKFSCYCYLHANKSQTYEHEHTGERFTNIWCFIILRRCM